MANYSVNTFACIGDKMETRTFHAHLGPNSTWLDSTRSTLSSESRWTCRAWRVCRAVLFQHGGRRTCYSARLYKFSRFYALTYTNPICFVK